MFIYGHGRNAFFHVGKCNSLLFIRFGRCLLSICEKLRDQVIADAGAGALDDSLFAWAATTLWGRITIFGFSIRSGC